MSGWARVLDYLSHEYGLLFVVSAGNHMEDLTTVGMDTLTFEALTTDEQASVALAQAQPCCRGAASLRRLKP